MNGVERGSGTPLVLLHGFGVDHRILLPLDPPIDAAGGWRRIYLDLPGCGGTPIGDVASAEDVAAALAQEVRRRVGDQPFAVLGNSFGGMLARRIGHDFGDQVLGLATIAAVFVAHHERRDVPAQTVVAPDPQVLRDLGDAADAYREVAVIHTAENAAAFTEHVQPGLDAADTAGLESIAARYAFDAEPEDAWPAPFAKPALFVTGRQDHVVGYRDAWARLEHYPRGTFAVLDTAGHNVHLDQAATTAALVVEWLQRIRRAEAAAGRAVGGSGRLLEWETRS